MSIAGVAAVEAVAAVVWCLLTHHNNWLDPFAAAPTFCNWSDSYNQDSDIDGQGEKCLTDSGKLASYFPEWKLSQVLPCMEAAMMDDVLVLEPVPSVHVTLRRQPGRYGCAVFCPQ